jgi:hypothetical protein
MDIMLDLETFSSKNNAMIVSIGAVTFDSVNPQVGFKRRLFYRVIHPKTSVGHIDPETVIWWLGQSEAARMALTHDFGEGFGTQRFSLQQALDDFTAFCQSFDKPAIWGNGSDFDNVVLRNSYEHMGMKAPWSFRDNRCYRTLKALRPDIELERMGDAHNALSDAFSQAVHVEKIIAALKLN